MSSLNNTAETCCVYCGDYNECQDHVICVSYNSGNRRLDRGKTVNCCNMCNGIAGDFLAESIIEKAIYLEDQYQRRFSKFRKIPKWTRAELAELGKNLHDMIGRKQFMRELLHAKLKNLDRVINGYPPNPIRAVFLRKEVTSITKSLKHE